MKQTTMKGYFVLIVLSSIFWSVMLYSLTITIN